MIKRLLQRIGLSLFLSQFLFAIRAYAHCPLCTAGAGAAALGASYFGVKDAAIGVYIGAFAVALGYWSNKLLKKSHFKYQKEIIVIVIFLSTVIPISWIIQSYIPFYINWAGNYGDVFNRTYIINSLIFGSIFGGVIMVFSPWLSQKIKEKFHIAIPFQTMIIIFLLLIIAATILQLTIE